MSFLFEHLLCNTENFAKISKMAPTLAYVSRWALAAGDGNQSAYRGGKPAAIALPLTLAEQRQLPAREAQEIVYIKDLYGGG